MSRCSDRLNQLTIVKQDTTHSPERRPVYKPDFTEGFIRMSLMQQIWAYRPQKTKKEGWRKDGFYPSRRPARHFDILKPGLHPVADRKFCVDIIDMRLHRADLHKRDSRNFFIGFTFRHPSKDLQ